MRRLMPKLVSISIEPVCWSGRFVSEQVCYGLDVFFFFIFLMHWGWLIFHSVPLCRKSVTLYAWWLWGGFQHFRTQITGDCIMNSSLFFFSRLSSYHCHWHWSGSLKCELLCASQRVQTCSSTHRAKSNLWPFHKKQLSASSSDCGHINLEGAEQSCHEEKLVIIIIN